MAKTTGRYAPARRLDQVRAFLNSTGGATVYEIAERLEVSVRTAIRYLRALEDTGERLYDDTEGRKKIWRLMPSTREAYLRLTTSQMTSLYLSRRVFDFLEGTGFKEDLDEIFDQLGATLRRKDFVAAKNLERKLFNVNEAPYKYEGRIEDVNDIITALIREDRIEARHTSVQRGKKTFVLEPYTLLVYKKGLYLAGHSSHVGKVRTFALDGFRQIDWLRNERFTYPKEYDPQKLFEGNFGLIGGLETDVRIFFTDKVARFVRRRTWHPTEKIKKVPDGIELSMRVKGTVEIISWVLSFGEHAELLEPPELRQAVVDELRGAVARYT
jgi:predicted DNA-binding transcriptional regulator YafY